MRRIGLILVVLGLMGGCAGTDSRDCEIKAYEGYRADMREFIETARVFCGESGEELYMLYGIKDTGLDMDRLNCGVGK